MSAGVSPSPGQDVEAELVALRSRLERERKARAEVEAIAERATRELYQSQQELRLLETVAAAANAASVVEDALQVAVDEICAHVDWPVGHVYLLADDDGCELAPSGVWHLANPQRFEPFRTVTEATRIRSGVGLPGRVFASGEPVWIVDVTKDPNFPRARSAEDAGIRTGFAAPILVETQVAGVLELFTQAAMRPVPHVVEIVSQVSTQLGRVIERARVTEATRRAKEEAERANRAKSDFLSRMSHELRTPLNAILGFAQLLQVEELGPKATQRAQRIHTAGKHLLALIDEVLEISRIEAGAASISVEPLRAGDPLREAIDLVLPLATEREVELLLDPADASDTLVLADYQRLKQVLLNLLANGVKYNRPRGRVTASCQNVDAARLRFLVADSGIGMDENDVDKLFVPFERLGAQEAGVEGTGLGLALSRSLTEAMGGSIGVLRTAKGEGTVFFVELPVAEGWPGAADQPAVSALRAADTPLPLSTILYIEDNLSNFALIGDLLSVVGGVELIPAMQGHLGLELAVQHRPDLILLDLHLPDVPGEDVLSRLKRDDRTCDIPVIILSADAMPKQAQRLVAAGAEAYVTKPLDVGSFIDLLRNALVRRGSTPSPGRTNPGANLWPAT